MYISEAIKREADNRFIGQAVSYAETELADYLLPLGAIGMCFPDVCVNGFIVGGETPKTEGVRRHSGDRYEEEFGKLMGLAFDLRSYVADDGVVVNINDGPMSAWTAAVELAATGKAHAVNGGIIAHSLGTDLGTGWVTRDGHIPPIPLEGYKLTVDHGNYRARKYDAGDVRSTLNTGTDLPGSPQKTASQAGAFRLAEKFFRTEPDLHADLFHRGFLVRRDGDRITVPAGMRKPFLDYLMRLPDEDGREPTREIFREIGRYVGRLARETDHLLKTGLSKRFMFGRLAKDPTCLKLMQEGARETAPQYELVPADDEMAHTPLMLELAAHPDYTVAQFAQAVGAIHLANSSLRGDTSI